VGPLVGGKLASRAIVPWFSYATPFWAMLIPLTLTLTLVAVALFFRETHRPGTTTGIDFAAAFYNISTVFRPTRTRILYLANFAFYLGIFGFFRCYPMYLVDEFHLDVSKKVLAESASGLVGGLIAALLVKGSLLAMAAFVLAGSTVLLFGLRPRSDRVATKSRT
jgi:hypothetical protein